MTTPDIARMDRLPKWAINELNRRSRQITDLQAEIRDLKVALDGTDRTGPHVLVDPHGHELVFPADTMVRFIRDERGMDYIDVVMTKWNTLDVRSTLTGLKVLPRASNSIEVEVTR